jgi:hypothetical protein
VTFEIASFFIGIVAGWTLLLLGAAVIATVQHRLNEEKQWKETLSAPSPSETFRDRWKMEYDPTKTQPLPEGEEWVRINPPSPQPKKPLRMR